MEKNNSL